VLGQALEIILVSGANAQTGPRRGDGKVTINHVGRPGPAQKPPYVMCLFSKEGLYLTAPQ
jgi:hypothetical protein